MCRFIRFLAALVGGLALAAMAPAARAQRPWSGARPAGVELLDVGQGDAILIRSPEGKTALIDAGPTREGALEALRRAGVEHLDLVAISHHHSDHYGGMEEVVRAMGPRY